MRNLAAAMFLFLFAGLANAQWDLREGPYSISGVVIGPGSAADDQVEVRLTTEAGLFLTSARAHRQEPFRFQGLAKGTYYVEVDAPGLNNVRERVELNGIQRDVNVMITLESQANGRFLNGPDMTDDNGTVDIKDLGLPKKVLKEFQEAVKKLQKGDVSGARAKLEALLASAPDFYDAHKTLGIAYQQSRNYRDAEKQYQLAQDLRPKSSSPLILLGSLYLEEVETGRDPSTPQQDVLERARGVLLRAIELDPREAFARYLLGVTYYRLGSYGDAENTLIRALELESRLGDIRLALANVYIKVQDWSKALLHVDTYLKENPRAPNREGIMSTRSKIAAAADSGRVERR